MNRIITSLFIIFMAATLPAQKLTEESMEETTEVITADKQRTDLNGRPCALVYVQTTDPDLEFEGNIIGDVEFNKSRYKVYLSSGSKSIRILGNTFTPTLVEFSDYKIESLEGKRVYILDVVSPSNGSMAAHQGQESQVSTELEPVSQNSLVVDNGKALSETAIAGSDREFTVNGVTFKMKYIEGGTFDMGAADKLEKEASSDEKPVHNVTLSDYMFGETEVTQELWQAVMGKNPSKWTGNSLPVERVSWDDCQEFINKLNSLTGQNFSLPTEAQWEYAAKGGKQAHGYLYSGSDNIGDVAWYDGNSGNKTHPVATKAPNELGLYDMTGNVWEWCSDWYDSYGSTARTNPTGPSSDSGRVLRGGSWIAGLSVFLQVSYRIFDGPDSVSHDRGLRLALMP